MSQPRAHTYQAEILRFIHEQPSSTLRNTEVGVVKVIWDARGQLCGENRGSLSSALSDLENKGCVISETGTLGTGRRGRIAVAIVEEPPHGETVYHPQSRLDDGHAGPGFGPDGYPTAEEVATELLRLAVAAASVPVVDIQAALHHNECLRTEIDEWVQVAEEAEERTRVANAEALRLREELDEAQAAADKLDAEWAGRITDLETKLSHSHQVISRLETEGGVEAKQRLADALTREQSLRNEVSALKRELKDTEKRYDLVREVAAGNIQRWEELLDAGLRADLDALVRAGRAARKAVQA